MIYKSRKPPVDVDEYALNQFCPLLKLPHPGFNKNALREQIDYTGVDNMKAGQLLKLVQLKFLQSYLAKPDDSYIRLMYRWNRYIKWVSPKIDDKDIKSVLAIILSRTVRSCRATTHADLATLKEPVTTTYYCKKHGKICKPLFSIKGWWQRYTIDTITRLQQFNKIRTDTHQICLPGDSRTSDIYEEVKKRDPALAKILSSRKIKGIFTSPPYVGLIDYHEQHAYAYELLGFNRRDELEIGPLYKGNGLEARNSYIKGVACVLLNCKKFLQDDYDIFLVANDKFDIYPKIADLASMRIVDKFKRPVLNRVEKDRNGAYSETIFHLKEK